MNHFVLTILTTIALVLSATGQVSRPAYLQGCAHLLKGNADSAVIYLTEAITADPTRAIFYLKRGEAWFQADRYDLARSDFEKANALVHASGELGLARTFATEGKMIEAALHLKAHLVSDHRLSEKILKSDPAFEKLKFTEDWYLLWQREWYSEEEKLANEVEYLTRKGAFFAALDVIDEWLKKSKNPATLYALRANVSVHQGNLRGAVADWGKALDNNSHETSYLIQRGKANLELARYAEATADFSSALRSDEAQFDLYLKRAQAWFGLKDYAKANRDMELYISLFPEDTAAIQMAGKICYQGQNYIAALKYFNQNLKVKPAHPDFLKWRGKTYFQVKMYSFALNDLSMALDIKPVDGESYYFMGLLHLQNKRKLDACEYFKLALKYGEPRALEELIKSCK